jgi:ATP-dependent DNA helicase DinG
MKTIDDFFSRNGLLAEKIPAFEFRPVQREMALSVGRCIAEGVPLIVEAGTGTGKTWAYLIPSILSGAKVLISTATKTLQDQVFDRDLPLLKKLFFPDLHAVCVKGRRNYLCLRRLREFTYQPSFWNPEEAKLFRSIQQWSRTTRTGDRTEMEWLPDDTRIWNDIAAGSDGCLGQACDDFSRCFLTRLRMEASRAHLLVVNHHLYFADLVLKNRGFGEVLPEHDAVVFDEAHQLEDIAGTYFGLEYSSFAAGDICRDLEKAFAASGLKQPVETVRAAAAHIAVIQKELHQVLGGGGREGSRRLPLDKDRLGPAFEGKVADLSQALEHLQALASVERQASSVVESCHGRLGELIHALHGLASQEDASLVYWYETAPSRPDFILHATPLDIGPIFRDSLFQRTPSVVLTSATLSTPDGRRPSFRFVRERLGLPPESRECLLPSPFDYASNTILYVPRSFPAPQEPGFCQACADHSRIILEKTGGRALFLFTSFRNMHRVYEMLRETLRYPVLVQGQQPKRALLDRFKESIESVLFATYSFWEGIDVPGEALSCVLIDKLPFEVPDDPITAARIRRQEQQGASGFTSYQIPRAVIHLKQGVGRLIRSQTDRGLVVIFDVRLHTKPYGRIFFQSLAPIRPIRRLEEIDSFFKGDATPQRKC